MQICKRGLLDTPTQVGRFYVVETEKLNPYLLMGRFEKNVGGP
jgi:hypothetical protein